MAVIKKYDVAGDTAAETLIGESGYFNTTNDDTRYTTTVTSSGNKFTEKTFYDGNYISYTEYDYTDSSTNVRFVVDLAGGLVGAGHILDGVVPTARVQLEAARPELGRSLDHRPAMVREPLDVARQVELLPKGHGDVAGDVLLVEGARAPPADVEPGHGALPREPCPGVPRSARKGPGRG